MLKKILSLLFPLLLLVFFTSTKEFLLDCGFSWSLAFLVPYLLLFACGFFLMFSFQPLLKKFAFWVQLGIRATLFLAPFGIGFAANPIYEGDVFGQSKTVVNIYPQFQNYDLVLLTIPECKYCHETIRQMNRLQQRNGRMRILYVVCSSNRAEVGPYRQKLNPKIDVQLATDLNQMTSLAGGSFPVYLHIQGKQLQWYDNNNFGTRALDRLEANP